MAFLQCSFFSQTLKIAVSVNAIVPTPLEGEPTKKYPVLYLLHGLSDDHTIWSRRTSVERYVENRDLIVIMPAVNRSFYRNMECGPQYYDFIVKELPCVVKGLFPVSEKREDTFIAGLSMGGYGAFKIALRNPEMFVKAASMSGVMDIEKRLKNLEQTDEEAKWVFGGSEGFKREEDDLYYLVSSLKERDMPIPDLFQCCGTEDFLYEDNIKFKDFLEKLGIGLIYSQEPAIHSWDYWDKKIQDVLNWICN